MTSIEAYKRFQLKLNKLDSSDNIDIVPGEFVLLFNEQQVNWYWDKFDNKSDRFDIDTVQLFIEPDKEILANTVNTRHTDFILPTDYLDYIKSYCLASRATCKDRVIRTFQVKMTDIEGVLRDESNAPSFDYQETPITLAKNKIQVYTTDFKVGKLYLTYYRYPVKIDITGYSHIDGTPSINIDPELSDDMVDEVINLCVLEAQRITENGDGFQLSNNRSQEDK